MTAPLFVTTFAYAYAKLAGDKWKDVLAYELANLDESQCPGFRTIGQARRLGECIAMVDGSTLITKARSRAAGQFLRSPAAVWLSVDDDVYADQAVLARLVSAAEATRGLVAAPCILRDGHAMNFHLAKGPTKKRGGQTVCPVDAVGFGLVAVHREAIERLAKDAPSVGLGEASFPALFVERVVDHTWQGEDFGFCVACREADIPVHLLCEAAVQHAGRWSQFTTDMQILVGDDESAKALSWLVDPLRDLPAQGGGAATPLR